VERRSRRRVDGNERPGDEGDRQQDSQDRGDGASSVAEDIARGVGEKTQGSLHSWPEKGSRAIRALAPFGKLRPSTRNPFLVGRSGSGLRVWIGVLVTVLMVAAFTPAVLSRSTMSAKSQTIPAGVSSKAVVLAGAGHFAPPHSDSGYDANGNGLFDFLLVNASVQITAPGNFTVSGTLH